MLNLYQARIPFRHSVIFMYLIHNCAIHNSLTGDKPTSTLSKYMHFLRLPRSFKWHFNNSLLSVLCVLSQQLTRSSETTSPASQCTLTHRRPDVQRQHCAQQAEISLLLKTLPHSILAMKKKKKKEMIKEDLSRDRDDHQLHRTQFG